MTMGISPRRSLSCDGFLFSSMHSSVYGGAMVAVSLHPRGFRICVIGGRRGLDTGDGMKAG